MIRIQEKWKQIEKRKILLPVTAKNEPDYAYMENYMKQLEYNKLNEYLTRKMNRKAHA